jgi:RNA polymerase primary sigma factor
MQAIEERKESILKTNLKYFHHVDFDKKITSKKILGDIPDKHKFDLESKKVLNLRNTNKQPEMRPCYEEPLLTREQEYHLFKQLNFLKFKAKNLIEKLNCKKSIKTKIEKIENLQIKIYDLRNKIASSNFRLATHILKNDFKSYREKRNLDNYLSDAYMDVIKSVDYFNYTLGNKFSTYCVWVLRKNFFRMINLKKNKKNEFYSIDDNQTEIQNSAEIFLTSEVHQKENAIFINRVIETAKKRLNTRDINRQILIIEHYFGINGKERKNLEEISGLLEITKERVRQLKEKFLISMRETVRNTDCKNVL